MSTGWPRVRQVITGLAAVGLSLAVAQTVAADVGIAWFSPSTASPGSSVVVGLEGCTHPAAEVRIALVPQDRIDADQAVDVAASDAAATGSYRIVVPSLEPGLYEVLAACPRDGVFGFWGSEEALRILGAPDTSTNAQHPAMSAAPPDGWRGWALAVAAVLGLGVWIRRISARGHTETLRSHRRGPG